MNSKITLLTLILSLAFLSTGCQSVTDLLDGTVYEKEVKTEVVETPILGEDNQPLEDENGAVVTKTFERPVVDENGEPIYRWTKSGETEFVESFASASGIPWAGTAAGILASAGLAILNRRERKRRQSVEGDLSVAEGISAATIAAIEDFSKTEEGKELVRDGRNVVKSKVEAIAKYLGVDRELAEKVQRVVKSGK